MLKCFVVAPLPSPALLHTPTGAPCFTVTTACFRTDPGVMATKAVPNKSTSRGQCLTYPAQSALAGCSSAPAAALPVAPPDLCLLAAALPLLAATCPAVLRWLASRLKWCAGQTAAALSAVPEYLAAPLACIGCLSQHPAKRINSWHSSVGKCFIGRSSALANSQNSNAVFSAVQDPEHSRQFTARMSLSDSAISSHTAWTKS